MHTVYNMVLIKTIIETNVVIFTYYCWCLPTSTYILAIYVTVTIFASFLGLLVTVNYLLLARD